MIEIPVICSWCKKSLGVVEVDEATVAVLEEASAQLTSDGVCADCDAKIREAAGLKKRGG